MPGVAPRLLLMLLLSITAAVYIPALDSGYYIDDYYNLRDLSEVAARGYGSYVLSGISGPAGRPLSLLSFAVQHESWPQSPADFKAVNLALHLLIGFLLGVLVRRLGRHLNAGERQASWVGVVAAGIWLLHPMQLTTVLYTIQRMTQLCTLFVLLGLLGFLAGRRLCELRRLRQGYALMSIAIAAGTFLAVLSKENGVLLPLLALIMDVTLL
ncbi:MAG: tetratricopeptide repeat protein, partial [Gammaproteobacteria bacterium]|nr:tetratricopeptide repeat protein [Gammaproteobacteria bacterium]